MLGHARTRLSESFSYLWTHRAKALLAGAAVLFLFAACNGVLAIAGSPGACGASNSTSELDRRLAGTVNRRWHAFDDGSAGTRVSFTEEELAARARVYADERGLPLSDVAVCIDEGQPQAAGSLDLLFGIHVRGTLGAVIRFEGRGHPDADITSVRIGAIPTLFTDPFEGLLERLIDSPLHKVDLEDDYEDPIFREGSVEIRRAD